MVTILAFASAPGRTGSSSDTKEGCAPMSAMPRCSEGHDYPSNDHHELYCSTFDEPLGAVVLEG